MSDERRNPSEETDFGFRDVPREAKKGLVRDVFESVARRYDLMNDLMSGGVHRLWKAALIDRLKPRDGMAVLDVAGGTGDVAFRIKQAAPGAEVAVCDITPGMLAVGRDRGANRGLVSGLHWVCGDAEALPIADRAFDAYTVAFGLRNVTDRMAALSEARRVLKPGGHFLCLEFSRVAVPFLGRLYDRYSFEVVPRLGQVVARDRESYQYLVESIRRFPPQEEFAEMLREAGLRNVGVTNLTGGVAAIHSGWRI